ncbi:PepSY-like domain-containing protein [Niabella beijingensis]|uniref:PepSY-like domain-containing protein n=1 Tax=Niabella beijingensis TaxID=2872700 RepID=UPI001CBBEA65|nr:PepSY-like domain-containing protein [Niabella beijingensis]MBZ4192434.1 PepSY-like domain-containing protein [Niabella beijingensis]
MKKLVFLLTAAAGITVVNAQKIQEKSIPASVKSGLQKQFPDVKNVKWENEDGNYEAGFKQQGTSYSVLLTLSGDIVETEIGMSADALAAPIKDYVAKNYPGQKIKEAAKITDAKGAVTYEAEVKGKDLIFDEAGKFIKEQKD